MTTTRFAKAGCFIFIVGVAIACHSQAQTPSVREYFKALVDHYDPSSLPTHEELRKVTGQLQGLRPEEITKALPAIFGALAHQNRTVKGNALSALYVIAMRPDGADLLRSHIQTIGQDLLTSSNPDTRAGEIVILGSLKPVPPPEVIPIFLTFLKLNRTDPDAQVQGSGIIFELVQFAPDNPGVIAAIREFLSRPLEPKNKIGLLNALGNKSVKDPQIIAEMIASLDDPDPGVRDTAIHAVQSVPDALPLAEASLRRLADDPKQPDNVRTDAKNALKRIHPR